FFVIPHSICHLTESNRSILNSLSNPVTGGCGPIPGNTRFYKTKKQGRRKTDQSNALAMLLQKIESNVIMDHVVPRIEREFPELPVWTIHDSIKTVRGEEENIARMIREEAAGVIGIAPTVAFECR